MSDSQFLVHCRKLKKAHLTAEVYLRLLGLAENGASVQYTGQFVQKGNILAPQDFHDAVFVKRVREICSTSKAPALKPIRDLVAEFEGVK